MNRGWILLTAVLGIMASGMALALFNMGLWFENQEVFSLLPREALSGSVLNFFAAEFLAVFLIAACVLYLVSLLRRARAAGTAALREIVSRALGTPKSVRAGTVAGLLYAVAYLFSSGTLVYQPGVDFVQVYGVSRPEVDVFACCGAFGTVPKLVLYSAPQWHLALQLVPLTALFVVLIPVLIGFNFTLVSFAFLGGPARSRGTLLSTIGASIGLFTACPTCAGLFLASAVGGVGATGLAVALAPYQVLFISVSIPVLILSPLVVAASMKRYLLSYCGVR